jgi:hypothetical protein
MAPTRHRVAACALAIMLSGCKRDRHEIVYPPRPPPPIATQAPDAGAAPVASAPQPLILPETTDAAVTPAVAPECRGASFDLDQIPASCATPQGVTASQAAAFAVRVEPNDARIRLGGDVALDVILTNTSSEPASLVWDRECFAPVVLTYDAHGKRSEPETAMPLTCSRQGSRGLVIEPGGNAKTRVFVHTMDRQDPASLLKVLDHGGLPPGPYKRGRFDVRIVLPIASDAGGFISAKGQLTVL